MANMTYCRFTNTLSDLEDCFGRYGDDAKAIRGSGGMTDEERESRQRLLKLCEEIVANYGGDDPDMELEAADKCEECGGECPDEYCEKEEDEAVA